MPVIVRKKEEIGEHGAWLRCKCQLRNPEGHFTFHNRMSDKNSKGNWRCTACGNTRD